MSIFDFSPVVDVAEKLAKKTTDNVVNQDKKPSLNDLSLQIPENVVQNIRQTWNQLSAPVKQQQASQAQAPTSQQQSQPSQQPQQEQRESKVEAAVAPLANNTKPAPPRSTESEQRDQNESEIQQNIRNAVSDIVSSSVDNTKSIMKNMRVDDSGNASNVKPLQTERSSPLANDGFVVDYGSNTMENNLEPSIETNGSYRNDPSKLAELQEAVNQEQARRLEQGKQIATNQLMSQYAMSGINPYSDPLFQQRLDSIESMTELPSSITDAQRRFTDSNGNFEFNPINWDILGFTSQDKSSDAVRNLYEYGFANDKSQAPESYVPAGNKVVDSTLIDDGSNPSSREGIYMTGEQYIKYRTQFGIPGRDVDDIQPDKLYSKQDEMENQGFLPYIVSDEGMSKFHDNASSQFVNNSFNNFSNARRDSASFNINIDGKQFDGNAFIKQMQEQSPKLNEQLNDAKNWGELTEDVSGRNENSRLYDGLINTDTDEVKHYAPSQVSLSADGNYVVFPDGTRWASGENVRWHPTQNVDDAVVWQNFDDSKIDKVKMSDGSTIDGLKAFNLMEQISNGGGENIDFGPMNWGKPVVEFPLPELSPESFTQYPGKLGSWLASGEFAPWFTDLTLGSLPFFSMPVGASRGMSRAYSELGGFSPDRNSNGTYSMISADPTVDQAVTQALGSAAMPFTEHLWGPLGQKGLGKLFPNKLGEDIVKTWSPAKRYRRGVLGEALEEVPGNLTEELEASGATDFYKDRVPFAYDSQGRQKRADTPFANRVMNFIADIPEAMIGGAALGGILGIPAIPSYARDYAKYLEEVSKYGDSLPETGPKYESPKLTEDEINAYNAYNR